MFLKPRTGNIKEVYYFRGRVGEGSFGVVYLAKCRTTEHNVAIKSIPNTNAANYQVFLNEC